MNYYPPDAKFCRWCGTKFSPDQHLADHNLGSIERCTVSIVEEYLAREGYLDLARAHLWDFAETAILEAGILPRLGPGALGHGSREVGEALRWTLRRFYPMWAILICQRCDLPGVSYEELLGVLRRARDDLRFRAILCTIGHTIHVDADRGQTAIIAGLRPSTLTTADLLIEESPKVARELWGSPLKSEERRRRRRDAENR